MFPDFTMMIGGTCFSRCNHYLTIVLYIIYILLLSFAFIQTQKSRLQNEIALVVLSIVQLSLVAFAIISRHASGVFEVKVIPWGCWLSGWRVTGASLLLGLSPSFVLALYGILYAVQKRLYRRRDYHQDAERSLIFP